MHSRSSRKPGAHNPERDTHHPSLPSRLLQPRCVSIWGEFPGTQDPGVPRL